MKQNIIETVKEVFSEEFCILNLEQGKSLLMLYFGYTPFEHREDLLMIDSYYLASNSGYFATLEVVERLRARGTNCQKVPYEDLNLKRMTEKAGGVVGKNTLSYVSSVGSLCFIGAIYLLGDFEEVPLRKMESMCDGCKICQNACPTSAIGENGYTREKCIRHWQTEKESPKSIQEKTGNLWLGCGICQQVCPMNSKDRVSIPQEILPFLQKTKDVDYKALEKFVGKNKARENVLQPNRNRLIGEDYE